MAKKEEAISMIDTLAEFKELKNIDKDTMISVLEESFRNVIAKMFGTDENFDVIINPEKGDFEIWRNRKVIGDDEELEDNRRGSDRARAVPGLRPACDLEPAPDIGLEDT